MVKAEINSYEFISAFLYMKSQIFPLFVILHNFNGFFMVVFHHFNNHLLYYQ